MNNDQFSRKNTNKNEPEQHVPDTEKLVHKHLEDESHVISEEEMQSIRITTEHQPQLPEDLPVAAENKEDDEASDLDKKIVTPWDITT